MTKLICFFVRISWRLNEQWRNQIAPAQFSYRRPVKTTAAKFLSTVGLKGSFFITQTLLANLGEFKSAIAKTLVC